MWGLKNPGDEPDLQRTSPPFLPDPTPHLRRGLRHGPWMHPAPSTHAGFEWAPEKMGTRRRSMPEVPPGQHVSIRTWTPRIEVVARIASWRDASWAGVKESDARWKGAWPVATQARA